MSNTLTNLPCTLDTECDTVSEVMCAALGVCRQGFVMGPEILTAGGKRL